MSYYKPPFQEVWQRYAAITHHMEYARTCRAVLDRIRDTDHERRRATVALMQDHVTKARQLNHTIIRAREETPR